MGMLRALAMRRDLAVAVLVACLCGFDEDVAAAQRAAKRSAHRTAHPPAVLQAATADQLEAAQHVYYGHHDCELNQAIDVSADPQHDGYVRVRNGKASYTMKPVLSSTGAVRLEDVRGVALLVQIESKSMLLDVKAGRRLVDECVGSRQRELMAEAQRVRAAAAAASAAGTPSAAEPVPATEPKPSEPEAAAVDRRGSPDR